VDVGAGVEVGDGKSFGGLLLASHASALDRRTGITAAITKRESLMDSSSCLEKVDSLPLYNGYPGNSRTCDFDFGSMLARRFSFVALVAFVFRLLNPPFHDILPPLQMERTLLGNCFDRL
jgi:hypothetical protein